MFSQFSCLIKSVSINKTRINTTASARYPCHTSSFNYFIVVLFCSITEEVNAIQELRVLITSELERMRSLLSERKKMLLAGAARSPVCSGVTQKVMFYLHKLNSFTETGLDS